jgi:putative transposase
MTSSHPVTKGSLKKRTINESIAIMLRSYTRAINKQQNRSVGLFREETKAECITKPQGISPSFYNTEYGASLNIVNPEDEYPTVCFNYIHMNPVKAGLVKHAEDWEFSSFKDYCGIRKGKMIDKNCAKSCRINIQPV